MKIVMSEFARLITDISNYVNSPNGTRAEMDIQGRKIVMPDPEEQTLRGYEISQMGPQARLLSLAWTAASMLKSGPDFFRGQDQVYVYKGLKVVKSNGSVATRKVDHLPEVEFIASYGSASRIAQDSSVKFLKFVDRPANERNRDNTVLEVAWEDLSYGEVRLKREVIVFGQTAVWRERSFPRQDGLAVTTIKLPVPDPLLAKAESILCGVQNAIRKEKGLTHGV